MALVTSVDAARQDEHVNEGELAGIGRPHWQQSNLENWGWGWGAGGRESESTED